MRWFMLIILSAVVLVSNLAPAQLQPPAPGLGNVVYVGADGKFESPPDTAVLQFNIAAQQDNARDAYDKASAAMEQVRQAMRTNGIDPKTAEFGFFAVQPMYDYKSPKQRVVGYRVSSNVTLKLHDFSKIGALTQQMAAIDSTENQSLHYTLENVDSAKIKATEDAMRKAQNEARAVATAGGRTLGELLYAAVDVNQAIVPVPMQARAMVAGGTGAAPAPPTEEFTPQSVTINAHVNAMFGLK